MFIVRTARARIRLAFRHRERRWLMEGHRSATGGTSRCSLTSFAARHGTCENQGAMTDEGRVVRWTELARPSPMRSLRTLPRLGAAARLRSPPVSPRRWCAWSRGFRRVDLATRRSSQPSLVGWKSPSERGAASSSSPTRTPRHMRNWSGHVRTQGFDRRARHTGRSRPRGRSQGGTRPDAGRPRVLCAHGPGRPDGGPQQPQRRRVTWMSQHDCSRLQPGVPAPT